MISRILGWARGTSFMPWLILICVVVAGVGGGAAGAKIATWRADAACAKKMLALTNQVSMLTDEKNQLTLAVEKQNGAIEAAKAQTDAAEAAKAQAERHAADLAQFSQSRMDKLQQAFASATTCDDVLKRYWELRQ